VVGRRTDVLASNRLARAVLTHFEALPAVHRNLARFMLLDPAARELYADWETNARDAVAILRLEAGRHPTDRQLSDLVGELTVGCPEFAGWWDDRRVRVLCQSFEGYLPGHLNTEIPHGSAGAFEAGIPGLN
jgi:MmyB-like transcription regulator ligand binding domain